MDRKVENKTSWVLNLFNTVQRVQSESMNSDSAVWKQQIEAEIRKALDTLPAEDRMDYLVNALLQKLRVTQSRKFKEASSSGEQETKPVQPNPRELVQQLVEHIPQLPESARMDYAKSLRQAGLCLPQNKEGGSTGDADSDIYDALPETLKQRLGLVRGKTVNFRQAIKMLVLFLETLLTLDLLVWNMWKTLAPQSKLHKEAENNKDLRYLAKEYLSNNPEVSLENVSTTLDLSRQLIAGLLGAIGPIGRIYGRNNINKFSPEAIKNLVKMESSGFSLSQVGKFWKKYIELASDLSEAKIESQIHEAIVKYAEGLILSGKYRSS